MTTCLARADGNLLIGGGGSFYSGQLLSVNGDSTKQGLSAINTDGSSRSDFTFYSRMSASAQGGNPGVGYLTALTPAICAAVGNFGFGGNPSYTYDGANVGHILILNTLTGARY